MANNTIKAAVAELQALLECYQYLSSYQNQSASDLGKLSIYNRMYEILHQDEVQEILLHSINYPFEDYIYHIEADTQEFIKVLLAHIDS